jgi:hypothetical protein
MAGPKSTIIIKLVTANISNPVLPLDTLAISSAVHLLSLSLSLSLSSYNDIVFICLSLQLSQLRQLRTRVL